MTHQGGPRSYDDRPCWACDHFGGIPRRNYGAAWCRCPGGEHFRSQPERGCAFWTASSKPEVRIIVCGGRDYQDREAVFEALDRLLVDKRVTLVIHGAAPGADTIAGQWAEARGIPVQPCPADWKQFKSRAGPLRNAHMLTLKPDGVVAFPGGTGTADMTRQAEVAGVRVWRPFG